MRAWRLLLGMLAGMPRADWGAVGWRFGISKTAHGGAEAQNLVIYPSLDLLIPVTIGIVAAWVWWPLKLRISQAILGYAPLLCTGTWDCSAAYLVFHEGSLCLIIGVTHSLYIGTSGWGADGTDLVLARLERSSEFPAWRRC